MLTFLFLVLVFRNEPTVLLSEDELDHVRGFD
jgi:hypothetical protein